jgi:hypothetical protein
MDDIIIQTYKQHPNWVTAGLVAAGITGGLLGAAGIPLIISSGVSMPGLNVITDTLKPWGEGLAGGGALLIGGFILCGTAITGIKIWRYKDPAIYVPADDVDEIDNTLGDPFKVFLEWRKKIGNPSADVLNSAQNALNSLTYIILNSKEEKVIVKTLGLLFDLQNEAYDIMKKGRADIQGIVTFEAAADLIGIEWSPLKKTPPSLDITDANARAIMKQIVYARAYGWTKLNTIAGIDGGGCIPAANKHLNWISVNFNEQTPTLTDESVAQTLRSLENQEPMKTAKIFQPVEALDDLESEESD